MDPLSDVLSLLRPRSYMFRGLDAGGLWSLGFPQTDGIQCYAMLSGTCWLAVNGDDDPIRLVAGDCVLLTRNQSFRLASDTGLAPIDAIGVFSAQRAGDVATVNGGGDVRGVGGFFKFDGPHSGVLLALLPAVVHIRNESDRARLLWSIETMMQELREPQPGCALIAQHLGHMMLVLALRLYLAKGADAGLGWLFALADKRLGAAINAMHNDPAHRWTLQSLAERAGMSRAVFAQKFKDAVGEPAMAYLARWRMMLAGDRLVNSKASIATIAYSLGYGSDSAFSAAFRRVMGCSPRQYARDGDPRSYASLQPDTSGVVQLESIRD